MTCRFPGSPVSSRRRSVTGRLCSLGVVVSLLAGFAQSVWGQSVVTNDKRVALVIGISKYQFAPSLPNPSNDARRIAEALRRLNFQVEESYDTDYRTLSRTLRAFGIRAPGGPAAGASLFVGVRGWW